jgi:hypothetical protein
VPQTLCLTFCKITRAHLKRVLSDGEEAARGPADVSARGPAGPLLSCPCAAAAGLGSPWRGKRLRSQAWRCLHAAAP